MRCGGAPSGHAEGDRSPGGPPRRPVEQVPHAHHAQQARGEGSGFDHIVLQNTGPDPDGFLAVCKDELIARVRSLAPSS